MGGRTTRKWWKCLWGRASRAGRRVRQKLQPAGGSGGLGDRGTCTGGAVVVAVVVIVAPPGGVASRARPGSPGFFPTPQPPSIPPCPQPPSEDLREMDYAAWYHAKRVCLLAQAERYQELGQ